MDILKAKEINHPRKKFIPLKKERMKKSSQNCITLEVMRKVNGYSRSLLLADICG